MRKKVVLIITLAVALLIGIGAFAISSLQNNAPSETSENNTPVDVSEQDLSSLDSVTGEYSSTTDDISNENVNTDTQQGNVNESVEYRPVESIPSSESVMLNDTLMRMDTEDMKRRAYDMVFTLRNFDSNVLSDASAWVSKFSSQVDIAKAGTDSNKNILYQEDNVKWAQAARSYPEYQNKTRSIDFINIYMEPTGTQNVPVVSFKVVEESNADYPMHGSDHWKPINLVSSIYLVHFTADGGLIYSVKTVDKNILEKNIYNHPFDENAMFEGESSYYGR